MMKNILVIGIAGGSGSGKSTLTENLKKKFPEEVTVILHDDYYKEQHSMTYEERTKTNYDHPDAFETARMIKDIRALKEGIAVDIPVYDYTIHDRSDRIRHIEPTSVIIIDGILILENKELCSLMDIKIFVETDDDIRILRRIQRDVLERERSLQSVIDQYLTTVRPMHRLYVQPSRDNADIVIPEGGFNKTANSLIEFTIAEHIRYNSAEQ